MSGIFMDGGGHDQVGHGVQPGHSAGDNCSMDGGQPVHNHSAMHSGGDGMNVSSLLGLNQPGQHSFLAHLLGLDHNAHHSAGQSGMHSPQHPSQMPGWSSALQDIKVSTFFQGITISPGAWLLLMFMGFISWLFIVYFIRHHEPFANAVLGTGAAQSSTAKFDRQMIAGCNDALPLRTSSNMTLYAPSPPSLEKQAAPGSAAACVPPTTTYFVEAPSSGSNQPPAMGHNGSVQMYSAAPVGRFAAPQFTPVGAYTGTAPGQAQFNSGGSIINVPEYQQAGTRLRSIVTR